MTVGKPDTQPGSLSEMGMMKPQTQKPGSSTSISEATEDAIIMSDKIRGSDMGPDPQRVVEMVNRTWSP